MFIGCQVQQHASKFYEIFFKVLKLVFPENLFRGPNYKHGFQFLSDKTNTICSANINVI